MSDDYERIPELFVRRAEPGPGLNLRSEVWESAAATAIEKYWSGEPAPADRHCVARLLWSEDSLFARFDHALPGTLIADPAPDLATKSIGLWERDVCELFIGGGSGSAPRYFEFEVAPNGEWLDLALETTADGRSTDWEFRSGMESEAVIADGRVSIGMRIPWGSLGGAPLTGERRRGNLFRIVGSGDSRGYLAWSPTLTGTPNFHVPERFGTFVFGK